MPSRAIYHICVELSDVELMMKMIEYYSGGINPDISIVDIQENQPFLDDVPDLKSGKWIYWYTYADISNKSEYERAKEVVKNIAPLANQVIESDSTVGDIFSVVDIEDFKEESEDYLDTVDRLLEKVVIEQIATDVKSTISTGWKRLIAEKILGINVSLFLSTPSVYRKKIEFK